MTQKLRQAVSRHENRFPAEAEGDFGVVSTEEIAAWRENLADRFGIGKGRLVPVEEPS